MAKEAWELVGRISSTEEARQVMNAIAHMGGIDNYTFQKLVQAIEEQWKRFRG